MSRRFRGKPADRIDCGDVRMFQRSGKCDSVLSRKLRELSEFRKDRSCARKQRAGRARLRDGKHSKAVSGRTEFVRDLSDLRFALRDSFTLLVKGIDRGIQTFSDLRKLIEKRGKRCDLRLRGCDDPFGCRLFHGVARAFHPFF